MRKAPSALCVTVTYDHNFHSVRSTKSINKIRYGVARDEDFNDITGEEAERIRNALRHDHGNEMAGRDVPRQKRFFNGDGGSAKADEKRRRERRFRDALEEMLWRDQEYRALYEDLGDKLGEAETTADVAIADLQSRIAAFDDRIDDMLDRAARLPDGRRVFRFADGRVEDEFGATVSPDIADGIVWPPNAPGGEEYFGAIEERNELQTHLEQWLDYRNNTLGGIRDRYDDRNDPMEKGDLKDALEQIETDRPQTFNEFHSAPNADIEARQTPSKTFPILR